MASSDPQHHLTSGGEGTLLSAPNEDVRGQVEEQFGLGFEKAAIGMAVLDADGRFIRVNEMLAEIMRRSKKEMLATTWLALSHPSALPRVRDFMSGALEGGPRTYQDEVTFIRGDGEIGCGLFSASLITDDFDRTLFFFVQLFDISRRKAAEGALDEKTSWVKLLQAVAVSSNVATTLEDAVQRAVEEVCAQTGWPVGHVFRVEEDGKVASTKLWHLADPERYAPFCESSQGALMDPGEGLPGRVIQTGTYEWMNDVSTDPAFIRREAAREAGLHAALAFPVRLEDEVVAVMEFFSDEKVHPEPGFLEVMEHIGTLLGQAGEHRLIEEALTDNEERLRAIIDTASDAFIEIETTGLITDWNAQATALFGWERDEMIGRALCKTVIPERYREAHNRGLARFLETGEGPLIGQRIEISALRRDGTEFPVELALWTTTIGGATRFNAFIRDITERMTSQQIADEANRKLQVWVEELERRNHEISELIETSEDLRVQSLRDPLTNLFNRRYMEESLDREIRRAERSEHQLGVIMIDIDRFKEVNDTLGHDAGDAVLQSLAAFLQGHIRGGDIACRYGGEEFLLILPEAPLEATRERAENLRRATREVELTFEGKRLQPPTLSLGVAVFPNDGTTRQALLRAADAALYRAKNSGRDRVVSAGELL
ncbi:MAG: diguanylate cyclase [Actinomycetota bacterium]|nr:diguanylate cyclase [Actinomycetota bacterium]